MILKGSQRGGARQLSAHLLNRRDNEHVSIIEVRGFVGETLPDALSEARAIARGTKCKQYLFSLSLNPPSDRVASEADFLKAAEAAEERLGLQNHPRAIVIHEKHGRRHAHAVWSRINPETMRAANMAFYKQKLTTLSRELYLENDWPLPAGMRGHGGKSPLNFTLDEWQQAKRLDLDPRELKQVFQEAWRHSDNAKAFASALEERGYFLAKSDRRGFVAVDVQGEVFAIAKWAGVKSRDVEERMADASALRSVDETRQEIRTRLKDRLRDFIQDVRDRHTEERAPLVETRTAMTQVHQAEREALQEKQREREQQEQQQRQARFNKGLRGLWDRLTGHASRLRKQNEAEAFQAIKRDQAQRDALAETQLKERRLLQAKFDDLKTRHAEARKLLAREIARHFRKPAEVERRENGHSRDRTTPRGPEFPHP